MPTKSQEAHINHNGSFSYQEMELCLPTPKGFAIFKIEDIVYCRAQEKYTVVCLVNNISLLIIRPLPDYKKLLRDAAFFSVHSSFLINLIHVKEYNHGKSRCIVLRNGTDIKINWLKKRQFFSQMKNSFGVRL